MTKHTDTVCQRLMNGYARNSCDRFGDDLCQELLQYLPFRDKVRLECVSRQWERSVYAKQQTLHIEDAMKLTFDGLPVTKLLLYYSSDATKLLPQLNGVSVIERLLAKCAHIRHIVIRSTFSCANKTITYDRLLRAIADHCGGLVSFEYCEDEYNRISENAWRYLGEKSSKTMRNYVCGTDPFWRFVDSHYTFLKLCNNLKTIDNIKLKELINGEIIAPKLSEVKLTNGSDDTELMDAFVGRYKNTIKLFESGYSGSDLNHFMKQLSQLCLLENLSLFMSGVDISQFGVNFKSIAVNCSQLKYLSLDLDDTMASDISYAQLFNSINCCSQLKYLHLFLFEEFTNNNSEDSNKLSLQSLKGCSRLTHLNITIDIIDDKFFAGIEQCFPQLKVIDIQSNKPLTDKTMHCLAKVKPLKAVIIRDFDKRLQITDKGVYDVIENCVQLKSFSFTYVSQLITRKTIVKLIEIALKRPKISFNHRFVVQRRAENCKLIDYIESQKKLKYFFPANLKINH